MPPNKVDAYFDAVANAIRIEIEQPKGMRSCVVEISSDPNVPGSWHALDGTGIRRKLAGYAPGTYWIRVANQRAKEKSAYTTPVMVVVK